MNRTNRQWAGQNPRRYVTENGYVSHRRDQLAEPADLELWRFRAVPIMTALLLFTFAFAMTLSLGIKAPLNYSVFSLTAAALLLSSSDPDRFALDAWLRPK